MLRDELGRVVALLLADGRGDDAEVIRAVAGSPVRTCAALSDLAAFVPRGELRDAIEDAHRVAYGLASARAGAEGRRPCALPAAYVYGAPSVQASPRACGKGAA